MIGPSNNVHVITSSQTFCGVPYSKRLYFYKPYANPDFNYDTPSVLKNGKEMVGAGVRCYGSLWGAILEKCGLAVKIKANNKDFYVNKSSLAKWLNRYTSCEKFPLDASFESLHAVYQHPKIKDIFFNSIVKAINRGVPLKIDDTLARYPDHEIGKIVSGMQTEPSSVDLIRRRGNKEIPRAVFSPAEAVALISDKAADQRVCLQVFCKDVSEKSKKSIENAIKEWKPGWVVEFMKVGDSNEFNTSEVELKNDHFNVAFFARHIDHPSVGDPSVNHNAKIMQQLNERFEDQAYLCILAGNELVDLFLPIPGKPFQPTRSLVGDQLDKQVRDTSLKRAIFWY